MYKLTCQNKYPKDQYVLYRNKLTSLIRQSKINYYTTAFAENAKNSKIAWKLINNFTGKNKTNVSMPMPNLDVNEINRFFSELGAKAINNLPHVSDFKVTFPTISSIFVFDGINAAEVEQVTFLLPNSNSCSSDGLSSIVLKKIIDCISFPLSKIFNKSVLESVVPSQLKIAKVIPIFKTDDKTKLINYRPISNLPTLSKVMERLMYNRMMKFINKYNILTTCQYGFRPNHSTNFAIIDLINAITQHLNNKSKAAALFIDISKAFDSLNHNILLRKLEAYGFRGLIYNWLSTYLNNQYQYVDIADTNPPYLVLL